nr:MAG TPA: hypothetical protein [Caudoviricetes sp.]
MALPTTDINSSISFSSDETNNSTRFIFSWNRLFEMLVAIGVRIERPRAHQAAMLPASQKFVMKISLSIKF